MSGNVKGPAIFLAQFAGGYRRRSTRSTGSASGQPRSATRACRSRPGTAACSTSKAASSKTYCDEIAGVRRSHGLEITELSTHLQGQLVAVNPAYDDAFDAFAPARCAASRAERQKWAVDQVKQAAKASQHLGLTAHATFSGALAWPYVYPWPQRPPGLVETAFDELARRWKPILDASTRPASTSPTRSIPARTCTTARPSSAFSSGSKGHKRCDDQLRSVALRAAAARLSRLHRHLSRAHQRLSRQGRRVQSDRPAGRLSGYAPGSTARGGSARSATARSISAASSPSSRNTTIRLLGGARVGMLPQAPGGRRARGRGVHRSITSSA